METCDVLIVGGGPAGSSCAWKLSQQGVDVVVLDKAEFPRHKVCGGWITPAVIDDVKLDVDDYRRKRVLQPISRFLTGLIGCSATETDFGAVVSYGILRCQFDDYLLRRSGARLRLGEAFTSLEHVGGRWVVNHSISARVVIGAGGHFCPVARHVPLLVEPNAETSTRKSFAEDLPTVMAQETEFEMTPEQQARCAVLGERPELYFCDDLRGYGWIFRKGNHLNIGLGREGETQLTAHVSAFVDWLSETKRIPTPLPDRFRGHAYHLRTSLVAGALPPRILLIGDALGLADRHSGEGLRPAIESGLLAASCLLDSSGLDAPDLWDRFRSKLVAQFLASTSSGIAGMLPDGVNRWAATYLMRWPWFVRSVLLDRWFLHRHEAPLAV